MPEEVMAVAIISILSATTLGYTIVRAVSKHLERKHGAGPDAAMLRSSVDRALEEQARESEEIRSRVAELEERVDFAERLLSKGEPDRPPPGA